MSFLRYVLPFLLLFPPSWPEVVEKVERSVVPLQVQADDPQGTFFVICSAVVVASQKLLAEEHCFTPRPEAPRFADRVPVSIEAVEGELVLLSAKGRQSDWRAIEVRRPPLRRGEPVATVGYGFGGSRPIVTLGVVSSTDDPEVAANSLISGEVDFFNVESIRGESGGAIVDRKGRLISLVRAIRTDGDFSPNALTLGASNRFLVRFLVRLGLLDS